MTRLRESLLAFCRNPALMALAAMFAASYLAFGVRNTLFEDDYWCVYPPNDFVAAGEDPSVFELAGRIWEASGVNRFPTHLILHTVFPALRDHFWIIHLAVFLNHALNTFLLYRFTRRATGAPGVAYLAAALFVFWPLQCEVLFWASTFNYHVGMTLMLAAGLVWLRARPEAAGWWRRAWPALPLIFLISQFCEQALTASIALAALTAFLFGDEESEDRAQPEPASGGREPPVSAAAPPPRAAPISQQLFFRFVLQSLYLTAPVLLWAALYLTLLNPKEMSGTSGRVLPERYQRTPLAELPAKVALEIKTQFRYLPGFRYEVDELVGGLRRLPEMLGDHWWVWVPLCLLPPFALWAAWRDPRPADSGFDVRRLAGPAAFGVLVWLYSLAPLVATREHWPTLRLGYVCGVGQALLSAIFLGVIWHLAARSWLAAAAGRLVFAAILLLCTLCNMVEGWQYLKQHGLDLAHAEQVRRQFADDVLSPKLLLVADVPQHSQPLNLPQLDHIINVWAYPWVTRPFLRGQFPGQTIEYFQTGFAGDSAFDAQRMLDNWDKLYVFRFPRPNAKDPETAPPPTYLLTPVRSVRLLGPDGKLICQLRLPRMETIRDDSGPPPIRGLKVLVRKAATVTIPPELLARYGE